MPLAVDNKKLILDRFYRLHPKIIDLGLDRIERLLKKLGHPETKIPPVIHIAGTNGKGSTLAFLRTILEQSHNKIHLYTSPHLVDFSERITLSSHKISQDILLKLLEECEHINQNEPITFFEITTAVAFLGFSLYQADYCLLETGLGGRFDATNVVKKPALTLLSSISLDHQAFLGSTIKAIAYEKAGIIKENVPCITSALHPEALDVVKNKASEMNAPLYIENQNWAVYPLRNGFRLEYDRYSLDLPKPSLLGPHQFHNAGLATMAALFLKQSIEAIHQGIISTDWPARLQKLKTGPLVRFLPNNWELWLDGGHNPGAGLILAEHIQDNWTDLPLDIIVGMINTKDSLGFLNPLLTKVNRIRTITIPSEVNSFSSEDLSFMARKIGFPSVESCQSLSDAVQSLLTSDDSPRRILICGSLYLAGYVLTENY
jgi:dihydrofolate synthase/folylpolyglutamate synthase